MAPLDDNLRRAFEKAVINARTAAEAAARTALTALALERDAAPAGFGSVQRRLRNALRARSRQLGNGDVAAGTPLLVEEIAYEQWHRMLFARFLAENELLMHPEGAPVTLQDCADLALELGNSDAWQVATSFAARMLPGIFRGDTPAAQVRLAPEDLQRLERILAGLPILVFTSDDGLGWAYQFWQAKKKDEVNTSGRKIGGADLSPVTQLFTEDYMVQFLLHNSLGAWWAANHPESPLVKELAYLRFRDDGIPAAGSFPGWPERAAEVTVIDPCCGSGHFLVAAFELLRRMRMEEEGLSAAEATLVVLRDNLFGLELDARCTQIAAFALAFAAWKAAGYRPLPQLNIACSGVPLAGSLEEWTQLAGDDERLRTALARLHQLFKHAPDLGSLINPADLPVKERMFSADYREVEPLLERALDSERSDDPSASVFGDAARGVLRAARLLARQYTLVATNVPYLARGKQAEVLKEYANCYHAKAKGDLSTIFIERCLDYTVAHGTVAVVTPQNWLSQTSYKSFRESLLRKEEWNAVVKLGPAAFRDMNWWAANTVLLVLSRRISVNNQLIGHLDVSLPRVPAEKAGLLIRGVPQFALQVTQLLNPDARITLGDKAEEELLSKYADSLQGIASADYSRYGRCFWEVLWPSFDWAFQQSTVDIPVAYGGREHILLWENGKGSLASSSQARLQGLAAIAKLGVAVSQMNRLLATLYSGDLFDNNTAVIVPRDPSHVPAQ
ncbi:MAG: N-6 DNA methylase [Chloroflexi bacterium]|nr:N-6 DNA methylase [Chloroflexota bacterium]